VLARSVGDGDPGRPDWLFRGLSGVSRAIQNVANDVTLVAASDSTVLITGADGTGKEIAARNIHFQSPRRLEPFVPVRCRAVPPARLEVELFGDTAGEGGESARPGRFEEADGGTLFLDEIAAMDMAMQLRLLRVLQERTLDLGRGAGPRHVNVRIVATTRHDLDDLVAEGAFREDLYRCLSVFPIRMPELKERIDDLPVLIDEVQRRLQQGGTARMTFTASALEALKQHAWPGNLREVSDLVEWLWKRRAGREVDIDDLPSEYRFAAGGHDPSAVAAAPDSHPDGVDLERYLADVERRMIQQALTDAGGEVSKAAERLKLKRDALVGKMRKFEM
jgi:sigma-54 specific flagellar transcriptional regulator A